MDIREIFVGNYIKIYNQVKVVDEKLFSELSRYNSDDVQAIAISEKWMLNLNFKKSSDNNDTTIFNLIQENYNFEVLFYKTEVKYFSVLDISGDLIEHFLEHHCKVHILQNVFYKWTCEILDINKKPLN